MVKSPLFSFYKDYIFDCLNKRHNFLIDLNHDLLTLICKFLNLKKSFEYIDEKRLKSYDFDDFRNIVDPKFFYSSRKFILHININMFLARILYLILV